MKISMYKNWQKIVLIPSIGIDLKHKTMVIGWLGWSINIDIKELR